MLASITSDLAQPLAVLFLLCLAATFNAFRRKQWRSAFALLFITALFYAVGATPLSARLVERLENPFVRTDWESVSEADAIVVLGAAVARSDLDLNRFNLKSTTDRIITAFELARQNKAKALVFGGGRGKPSQGIKSEGEHVQSWYERWKISTLPSYVLPPSFNTHDEAIGTKELATEQEWTSILLVTSGTHMHRALATFDATGLDVTPVACDFEGSSYLQRTGGWAIVPRLESFYLMSLYLHEVVGWPYYRLRGWITDARRFIG